MRLIESLPSSLSSSGIGILVARRSESLASCVSNSVVDGRGRGFRIIGRACGFREDGDERDGGDAGRGTCTALRTVELRLGEGELLEARGDDVRLRNAELGSLTGEGGDMRPDVEEDWRECVVVIAAVVIDRVIPFDVTFERGGDTDVETRRGDAGRGAILLGDVLGELGLRAGVLWAADVA